MLLKHTSSGRKTRVHFINIDKMNTQGACQTCYLRLMRAEKKYQEFSSRTSQADNELHDLMYDRDTIVDLLGTLDPLTADDQIIELRRKLSLYAPIIVQKSRRCTTLRVWREKLRTALILCYNVGEECSHAA